MSEWTEILFTYDESEAQIVRDILEAEGIEVFTKSLKITPYPVSIGRIGEIRLLVKKEDFKSAEDVLRNMEHPEEGG